jgi:hypothetical protein
MSETTSAAAAGTMARTDLADIRVALARIDERTAAQATVAEHRHADLKRALAEFVPRREIEADNRLRDRRIAGLEAFRATVYRLALSLAGLVLAGLAFLGKLAGAAPAPPP